MNIKKISLLIYLRIVKCFFGFRLGSFFPIKNLHYFLVTNFFRAHPVEARGHLMFVPILPTGMTTHAGKKGRVFAFETDPDNFLLLKR
jgi:hypothetical protein